MASFHTVYMNLGVLLIECRACNHRAALEHEDGVPIWQGNMQENPQREVQVPKMRKSRCAELYSANG